MRRYLLATSALVVFTTPAAAQTVIGNARTEPVRTSTVKDGGPDAIRISSDGSVKPTSGTAVTMDNNNGVTNEGTIAISNANGAVGIGASAGTSGDIVNTGTITIDETYTPTDIDNDGDLDGPFAVGSGRYGIRTYGAHSGKIVNDGTITVEGNSSAGIWLGGTQTGAFTHNGKTTVLGDNSVAIHAEDIVGDVRLAGTVTGTGANAVGAHFAGDIDGAMVVQGSITATGYRYPTPPSNTSKLDADDLLQGGSALIVEGDVSGGIVLATAPANNNPNDNDEDKDGIDDSKEGNAAVVSYGAAPAMVIGAADRDIAIGEVAASGSKFGLIIDGTISGNGVYTGVNGNGLVIGGRGGDVTIANGMGVAGKITASSSGGTATALRIGEGATIPEVRVSGTIGAEGATATAIRIDAGSSVDTIRNSGTLGAKATSSAGSATAIIDASGNVTQIENSGAISATGAAADSNRNVAIDVSANTSGVTLRQTEVAAGITAPSIAGDVRFGSGNDVFEIADGSVAGKVSFGAGNNALSLSGDARQSGAVVFGGGADAMSLVGSSSFTGSVDFGGGADTLSLSGTSHFSGTLTNAGNLAVSVSGGVFDAKGATSIGSLTVGSSGVLAVTLSPDSSVGTALNVAGAASFGDGATLRLNVTDVEDAEGRFVVLQAGSLSGASKIDTDSDLLPFMYKGVLAEDAPANQLVVEVTRRNVQELGLNTSQATAYNAIYAALSEDDDIAGVFLGIRDGESFRHTLRQMLPDHAGGAFDGLSLGERTMARQLAEPQNPLIQRGGFKVLMAAGGWGTTKDEGDTAAYDLGGLGFSLAGVLETGVGDFGLSATYLWNKWTNGGSDNEVLSDTYQVAAFWRGEWGGFAARGRASIGTVDFNGSRFFSGEADGEDIERQVKRSWGGTLTSFSGGVSYEFGGSSFFIRPGVSVDYLRLSEDGYTETGGGEALDLIVESRTSDEMAVEGGVTLGMDLMGTRRRDSNWFRLEAEGGWRELVGGSIGATTAHFAGGESFTLLPEDRSNGWYGRVRAMGGAEQFQVGGEIGAEKQNDRVGMSLRASFGLQF